MTFGGGGSVMKNQYRGGLLGGLGQFAHLKGGGGAWQETLKYQVGVQPMMVIH